MNKNEAVVANDFIDILKSIIQQELSKLDTTIVCRIVDINSDGTYNVYIEPDENNIIKNISSILTSPIETGDYVYVYKIKNQLNNAFIIKKITNKNDQPLTERVNDIEQNIQDITNSLQSIAGQIGGGEISSAIITRLAALESAFNNLKTVVDTDCLKKVNKNAN